MTNLEKIQMYKNSEYELSKMKEEIASRDNSFQAYVAKIIKEYEESKKELNAKLNCLTEETKQLGNEIITINLADFLSEISKEYGLECTSISLDTSVQNPSIYSDKQALIESIIEKENLHLDLYISFHSINECCYLSFPSAYLKREDNEENNSFSNCMIYVNVRNDAESNPNYWNFNFRYNPRNIILNIPVNMLSIWEDQRLRNALLNYAKNEKQEIKQKSFVK